MSARASAIPQAHLEQLDAIDQRYWWHRVRWRAVRRAIRRAAPEGRFACYFDVGSGGGGLPGLLARDFSFGQIHLFDQHAVLPAKIPHDRVRQHFVDLERFDAGGLPAPDVVTCLDVLEHLRQPEQLLAGLRRASGRGCLLVATVPALPGLWSFWDELAGHHRRYAAASLRGLLEGAGWRVDECRYMFHAAVAPLWLRRGAKRRGDERLEFPELPGWLNSTLERAFWFEYLSCERLRLPFGSSLIAVAR